MSTFNVPAKNKFNLKINKMNLNLHSYTPISPLRKTILDCFFNYESQKLNNADVFLAANI